MTTIDTALPIENWDEREITELPDGGSVKRADVTLGVGPDGLGPGTMHSLLYYGPDGAGTFVTLLRVTGQLAGRSGTLVLVGEGTYGGSVARIDLRVVGGTEGLAGVSGTAVSESSKADYPNMPLSLSHESS
jgi:hypothetical protein